MTVITQHVLLYGLDSSGNVVPLLVESDGSISGSGSASGAAGGDLTGTYPNPTIANNAVTTAKILNNNVTSSKVDLTITQANVDTSQTTTSTSYTDLSTVGPSITPAPGTTQDYLFYLSARQWNSGANYSNMGTSIAGAAVADVDTTSCQVNSIDNRWCSIFLSSTVANNGTHTNKYKASAGTSTFVTRRLGALAI